MHEIRFHDSLCPAKLAPCDCELCDPYCACDILAQARFDEREQAAQRVAGTKRQLLHYLFDSDSWVCVPLDWAIAAARGEDTK